MFLALEANQERQEQRQKDLDAIRRHELQKLIGHNFFPAGMTPRAGGRA
jgi:hypothetical protein